MVARAEEPQEIKAMLSNLGSTRVYDASEFVLDLMNYQYCPVEPVDVQTVLDKHPYVTKPNQSKRDLGIGESVPRTAGLSVVVLEAAGVILDPVKIEEQLEESIEDLIDANDGFDDEISVVEALKPLKQQAGAWRAESDRRRETVGQAAETYLGFSTAQQSEIVAQSFRGSKAPLLRAADELQDDRRLLLPRAELIAVKGTLKQLIKSLVEPA